MSTWIIGDIHGAYLTLKSLLQQIGYPSSGDRLLLIGDLVNRGPRSLDVLRWAVDQGDRIDSLVGNHDLYCMARGLGGSRPRKRDTLGPLLEASDATGLLDWMRSCRLLIPMGQRRFGVHAGIHPNWKLEEAVSRAREAETLLQSKKAPNVLRRMFAKPTELPREKEARAVESLRILVTIRTCKKNGALSRFAGTLDEAPKDCFPWFDHPNRQEWDAHFFFGHWAALGVRLFPGVTALDGGCGWERELTAYHLESGRLVVQTYCD